MNNDETVLTCKFLEHQARLGRSLVIDLNSEPGKGFRQIDHRTIKWLISKNVKYIAN
jgi:hypothetical protein